MHIVVPIKQVPETSNVKMDEKTGTMIRDGVESIINPLDLYAIELALQLREKRGGKVTVCSMGPHSAEKCLREAVAMGCDAAILLSSLTFAGADTWATSYTLAQGLKKIAEFDLVITGERATDGDTGQVGPGIAAWLDLPLATYVSTVLEVTPKALIVERMVEEGYQLLKLSLPALMTVVKEVASPRLPTLRGKQRSRNLDIPVWTENDLPVKMEHLGLKGSPTRVVRIHSPQVTRDGTVLVAKDEAQVEIAIEHIVALLTDKGVIQ